MADSPNNGHERSDGDLVPALGWPPLTWLYDPVVALTTREGYFKRALLEQASIPESASVLDLGCGTGTLAVQLARSHPTSTITGIDGDETVLRRARRKASDAGLEIRFDRVMSTLFFHHLTRSQKVETARAVLRVLRPGGQSHIADWGKPTSRLMRLLFYSVQLLDGFETTADNADGLLPEIIAEAGFRDVRVNRGISTLCGTLALYSAVKP